MAEIKLFGRFLLSALKTLASSNDNELKKNADDALWSLEEHRHREKDSTGKNTNRVYTSNLDVSLPIGEVKNECLS